MASLCNTVIFSLQLFSWGFWKVGWMLEMRKLCVIFNNALHGINNSSTEWQQSLFRGRTVSLQNLVPSQLKVMSSWSSSADSLCTLNCNLFERFSLCSRILNHCTAFFNYLFSQLFFNYLFSNRYFFPRNKGLEIQEYKKYKTVHKKCRMMFCCIIQRYCEPIAFDLLKNSIYSHLKNSI